MPSKTVISFAKKTGKSVKEVEKLWNEAKEVASDTFGKSEEEFSSKEWSYTIGVLKNMLGLDESKLMLESFLSTEKSFDDFIVETQSSGSVSATTPINPIEVIDKDEFEEQEEDGSNDEVDGDESDEPEEDE